MARRTTTLSIIGILAFLIGGVAAYLLLTIPNDVRAEQLLREARDHIQKKQPEQARQKLQKIVLDYPRTDAAAAASTALFRIEGEEHERLTRENAQLKKDLAALKKERASIDARVKGLETKVTELEKKPAPPPPEVKKPEPVKKKAPAKKTTTRKRRR